MISMFPTKAVYHGPRIIASRRFDNYSTPTTNSYAFSKLNSTISKRLRHDHVQLSAAITKADSCRLLNGGTPR